MPKPVSQPPLAHQDRKSPPPPAPGPTPRPRPWAGREAQALAGTGPIVAVPAAVDTPEGATVYLKLGVQVIGLGLVSAVLAGLRENGRLTERDEIVAILALSLIAASAMARGYRQIQAMGREEPGLVAGAGLSRKEQLERAVTRTNRQALFLEPLQASIDSLRQAALLQSEDQPGLTHHITGDDVAQAIARLGRGAARAREALVPERVMLLQANLMTLLQEDRITVEQCARALEGLAFAVATQLKEHEGLGRPASERGVAWIAAALLAPFRGNAPTSPAAWNTLPVARAGQAITTILDLPGLDRAFGQFMVSYLAAAPTPRLEQCFDTLRRYQAHHIAAVLDALRTSRDPALRPVTDPARRVHRVVTLVARHPERLEVGGLRALATAIFRPDEDLPPKAWQAAKDEARRLANRLGPRLDDAMRQALTAPMVASLERRKVGHDRITREISEVTGPAAPPAAGPGGAPKDRKSAPPQPAGRDVQDPAAGDPEPGAPGAPGLSQAIERARAQAWADRGDRKGLNLQEQAELDARIAQMKAAAAGPREAGT